MGQPARVVKFEDLTAHTQAQHVMSEHYFKIAYGAVKSGVWAGISGAAGKVYVVIAAQTTGFDKTEDKISRTQLHELSGVKDRDTLTSALNELVESGLIETVKRRGGLSRYKLLQVKSGSSRENPDQSKQGSREKPVGFIPTSTEKPVGKIPTSFEKSSRENPDPTTYLPSLLTYTLRGWVEKSKSENPKPQNQNGKFKMFVGWLPNDAGQQLLKMRKVDLSLPEHSEVFADFLAYWATQDTERTEAEWNKTLLRDFSTGAKARRAGYSKTVEASKKKPSVRDVPVHTEGGVLTGW